MKKVIVFIIVLLLFIGNVYAYDFNIKSSNVIVVNLNDNSILYEKNANDKVQIASLTKIVTAISVIENVKNLDAYVTINTNMLTGLDGYAKIGLKAGNHVTYRELLYALMLPSAADAAKALALSMSGSMDNFAILMNNEVSKIGVKNTHFTNSIGMDDENNYSTAYDMYVILNYALKNDTFKKIFEAKEYHMESIDKDIKKTIATTSSLNGLDIDIIKGAKTGFTYDAGLCLASTASYNGVDYLIINLGGPVNTLSNITDPLNIYQYYFDNYEYKTIVSKKDLLVTIPVKESKTKEINIYSKEEFKKYDLKTFDVNKVEKKYNGISTITRKTKKGDKLGYVDFIYDGEVIYKVDVYLEEDIKFFNYFVNVVVLIIIIIVLFVIYKIIRRYCKVRRKRRMKRRIY